jgi:putative peptidoglycan lipid II flippase
MSVSSKSAKSVLIIIILSLVSKFLGFIREVLIAAKFGLGMETDTFFITISAITLLTGIISNVIKTTSVPILSEIETKEGKQGKINYTSNMINIVALLSTIVAIFAWFFSPVIISLIAKGFYGEQYNLAIKLFRIGLPMVILSSTIGAITGFLQSEQRHISSAAIGFPFNFVYIFYLVFLSSKFGIKGLMVAGVFAVLCQLLIQIPETKKSNYTYKYIFNLKNKYIRKVLHLSIPVLVGVAITDLNIIIDKTIASTLIPGSISALNYANKLISLVLGVFISAITTVIFPLLSKESSSDNIAGMKQIICYGNNTILLITIPATVGLIVLSTPIVQIAFQRGEFDSSATLMTSKALIFYSLGLISMSIRTLLLRVYYSLQDTKTPLINGALSVGLNIVLNLILVKFMAHAGLAFATSIAITIAVILMFNGLRKKIGVLGIKRNINCAIKSIAASLIMGIVAYLVYYVIYEDLGKNTILDLVALVSAICIAAFVYLLLIYLFKVEEIRIVVDKLKTKYYYHK